MAFITTKLFFRSLGAFSNVKSYRAMTWSNFWGHAHSKRSTPTKISWPAQVVWTKTQSCRRGWSRGISRKKRRPTKSRHNQVPKINLINLDFFLVCYFCLIARIYIRFYPTLFQMFNSDFFKKILKYKIYLV